MTGRSAARHCRAAALFNLGSYQQAAIPFNTVTDTMGDAPAIARGAMATQAGAARFPAERFEKAYATQTPAHNLAPHDSEILINCATTSGTALNYLKAINDLNRVIAADPDWTDVLILRASD